MIGSRLRALFASLDAARLAAVLLLAVPAVVCLRERLGDPDLWWHLRTGEWILVNGRVPTEDPFSYTAAGHPWIAYSWLAELVFYGVANGVGFHALIVLKGALVVATVGFVWRACAAVARPVVAVPVALLAALASAGGWGERPQLFTLLLLAGLVWALRVPAARRHLVWAAPVIAVLWANVHVLFCVGVGLLALAAACEAAERRPARDLLQAAALSLAASVVNPYGLRLLAHLPEIAIQPRVARAVTEFQSPDFATGVGAALAALLLVAVVVLAASRARATLFELVTFASSLLAALLMVRNAALFAILAAPTVARHADGLLPRRAEHDRPTPARLAVHWAIAAAAVVCVLSLVPRDPSWRGNLEPGLFPVAAADAIAARHRGARLFDYFDWGGFLIFRLYPANLVSIDGRTQMYGERILDEYLETQELGPGWRRFLEASRADLVVWPAGSALAAVLRQDPEWQVSFEDEVAVVYERMVAGRAADAVAPAPGGRHGSRIE
jgi:hypothetical protein